MKWSQFNSILPYRSQYILFNAFTQKFCFLIPELKELLISAIRENIDNLKNYHPAFYSYLIHNQFIINNDVNEIEKVKQLANQYIHNNDEFILIINPTMNCNFKCWYCYETHIKSSRMSDEVLKRIIKFIKNTLEQQPTIKNFYLSFFGGEPLLYFFPTIASILSESKSLCFRYNTNLSVSFTSNGYLINDKMINYFQSNQIIPDFQITLDGDKHDHNSVRYVSSSKGSFDKIVENIKKLISNKFYVIARINYTSKSIHSCKNIIHYFNDIAYEIKYNYLIFDFHRVWQDKKEDIDHIVKDVIFHFQKNDFNTNTIYSNVNNIYHPCYADKKKQVTINYNGDVFKCTARDFAPQNREGYLDSNGNIVWNPGAMDKRMYSKFKNKSCQTCRILPLCAGGCSQVAIENINKDYCIFGGDENKKDEIILSKVLSNITISS